MSHPLHPLQTPPLEREFESWITREIQNDLDRRRIHSDIYAVSPFEEASWPADLHLGIRDKIVGLQFKRPYVDPPTARSYSRLKWSLASPAGQVAAVVLTPEIFYCLPTFINREWFRYALHHCLFWRPDLPSISQVWYRNPAASVSCFSSPRWGLFLEDILSCQIGRVVAQPTDIVEFMHNFRNRLLSGEDARTPREPAQYLGLYLIHLGVEGTTP